MAPVDENEASLLAAIAADPEDAQAREVYADWLDKRADPRGEYVRLEAHYHAIPARLAQLAAAFDPAWLIQLGRSYDVLIVDAGPNKIGVIKVVREITSKGLKDAKDIVDAVPLRAQRIVTDVERDAAKRIAEAFKHTGASVRVVPRGTTAVHVPAPRGVQVILVAIKPDHRLAAMNLVREVRACGMREAFRLIEKVMAGTPSTIASDATVDRARELVALFTPLGTVQCMPA
jgi:large subunit ribosomal protein L7/L12